MLKDFLYLKEKNLKDIIELLLKAYSSSFSDSEQTLKRNHLGKAHHRLIILLDNNPGIKDENGFTPIHRFFLSVARVWANIRTPEYSKLLATTDPHPHPLHRVNITLANTEDFYKTFGTCVVNSPLPPSSLLISI